MSKQIETDETMQASVFQHKLDSYSKEPREMQIVKCQLLMLVPLHSSST